MLTLVILRAFINIWNLCLILLNFWILRWRRYISNSTIGLVISLRLIRLCLFSRFYCINNSPRKVPCFLAIIINNLALNIHNSVTIFIFLFFFTLESIFNVLFFCVKNSDDFRYGYGMRSFQFFFHLFIFQFLLKTAYTCLFNRIIYLIFV